jgi:hypothetical protein
VELNKGIAKKKELPLYIDVLEVASRTDKAVQVLYTLATGETKNCHKCGRALTDPVSQLLMYGPHCCADLGIDRSVTNREEALASLAAAADAFGARVDWFPIGSIYMGIADNKEIKGYVGTMVLSDEQKQFIARYHASGRSLSRLVAAINLKHERQSMLLWQLNQIQAVWDSCAEASKGRLRQQPV